MKKIILSIITMIAGLSQAQVIISNQASPTPTNSSVLLEFGNNENKGIILPSVSEVTNPVAGTFAVNTTAKAVQYYDGTAWVNLTYPDVLVENSFINDGTADTGEGVVIGAATSTKPGVLVLESTTQAMVLPHVADPHLNVLSPVAGTIVYDTTSDALAVYDGKEWSYWAAELDASGILPPNITLSQNRRHWIASVYDTDYLPYTAPTGPATINVVNANGTPEAVTVDHQGSITTTGITVQIPLASVSGNGTIGAWTSTFVVPAMYAEDGQSRTLELSWAAQSYTTTSKFITATIKSLGGIFNAKKLDINAGIGNDYIGLLLGAFQYPYNNAGTLTSYEVRDIPGIPDRMFGLTDNTLAAGQRHNFLYLPVQAEDGNIWLNNNLGADYSNLNSPSFNLTQQATGIDDFHAFGSLFQWGRRPDGHEIIKYNSANSATPAHGTTPYITGVTNPTHSNFITPNTPGVGYDDFWRDDMNTQDITLWQPTNANNPCPEGFKVPNYTEMRTLVEAVKNAFPRPPGAYSFNGIASNLKLPTNPTRQITGAMYYTSEASPQYWTSTGGSTAFSDADMAMALYNNGTGSTATNSLVQAVRKTNGLAIRCMKN